MKAKTMRASACPCNAHGYLHTHMEAVVLFEGDLIGHFWSTAETSKTDSMFRALQLADALGGIEVDWQAHADFDHSMAPEVGQGPAMGVLPRDEPNP